MLQFSDEQIRAIFNSNVRIFLTGAERIQQNIDLLRNIGFESDEIFQKMRSFESLFRRIPEKLSQNIDWFEKKGFSKEEIKKIFVQFPKIATLLTEIQQKNWDQLMNQVKFSSETELREFLIKNPALLTRDFSFPDHQQKIQFIKQKLNLSLKDALFKNGDILNYSLQEVLGPRSWIVQQKSVENIKISDIDKYLQLSDEDFVKLLQGFVKDLEEYKSLVEEWKQNQWPEILQQFQSSS
eukprot:TRINITY_DN9347_c0_g1_i4.p1 TRINITY_DN9347_c0_g1~~TRINITY_DN9347_c0_g1_i4.p1  ORF type:complete len:239 (+),score=45.26 TRINITY_DN9347_c0_g1_i4:226-942(+)